MKEQLAKSSTRLIIGLVALFVLLGLYSYTMYVGALYKTVDGYLLLLPIARLALMIMVVGVLLGLARPLSSTLVEGYGAAFRSRTWQADGPGPRALEPILYYSLMLAGLVAGYFMLRGKVIAAVSPFGTFWWVSLSFGLFWLALGIVTCLLFWKKSGELKLDFAEWKDERAQTRATRKATRLAAPPVPALAAAATYRVPASPAAPVVTQPVQPVAQGVSEAPPVQTTPAAAPRRCAKCGAEIESRFRFCKKCGAESTEN